MAYQTIPPSGSGATVVTDGITIDGDGSGGDPVASIASSAGNAGSLSVADFNKLATALVGNSLCQVKVTDPIDLVGGTGLHTIIAPTPRRLHRVAANWLLTTVGGTRSVLPAWTMGTNDPNYDDYVTSSTGASGLLTQAANTVVSSFGTAVNPLVVPDLTTSGLKLNITAGMTGAAPVCTARLVFYFVLAPV